MPDITMCRGTDCPKRKKCYRFMAKPNEYRQSYFVATPRDGKECNYFYLIQGVKNEKAKPKNAV